MWRLPIIERGVWRDSEDVEVRGGRVQVVESVMMSVEDQKCVWRDVEVQWSRGEGVWTW